MPGVFAAQSRVTDQLLSRGECRQVNVLYAGQDHSREGRRAARRGVPGARRAQDPRLHLVLAGGGPEQERLRERVGEARDLPRLAARRGARTRYASADIFFFPSATDTFGQVILEAQASGLPVLAVAAGGPLELIEDRVSGLLREADSEQLASALLELAGSPPLRERLAGAALDRRARAHLGARPGAPGRRLPARARGDAGETQHRQEVDRLVA